MSQQLYHTTPLAASGVYRGRSGITVVAVDSVPVVGQQPVAQDEPPPLVALQVVGPFKKPSFVGVRPGSRGRGRGGCRALPLVAHPPPPAGRSGSTEERRSVPSQQEVLHIEGL